MIQTYDQQALIDSLANLPIAMVLSNPRRPDNPLEIVKAVNELLPGINRVAPPGVKVYNQFDTAHFVNASIAEVIKRAPKMGKDQIIVMNLCGRGDKDIFTVGKILGMSL